MTGENWQINIPVSWALSWGKFEVKFLHWSPRVPQRNQVPAIHSNLLDILVSLFHFPTALQVFAGIISQLNYFCSLSFISHILSVCFIFYFPNLLLSFFFFSAIIFQFLRSGFCFLNVPLHEIAFHSYFICALCPLISLRILIILCFLALLEMLLFPSNL